MRRRDSRSEPFASTVSHDLRNPLRVVDGRLEPIQGECESAHVDDATRALDRMDTLIEDLLTLARDGKQVDGTEPIGLTKVANSNWQTVSTERATLDTDISRTVRADRSRLRQLFEDLHRNAVERSDDDVSVSVGAMDDGFYVADTGPGTPEPDREEVFDAGCSTDEDGTGFSLRIVEQILDAHGWDVTVTENGQGGARFEVTDLEFAHR
jgi:signal transduction histidine kinase